MIACYLIRCDEKGGDLLLITEGGKGPKTLFWAGVFKDLLAVVLGSSTETL